MSEHTFIVVPSDPWFVPAENERESALEFLRTISPSYEWELNIVSESPECHAWYDRTNAECPHCGASLNVHAKFDEWLQNSLSALSSEPAGVLTMPCCSRSARYQDVRFEPEIGFARCALGLHEPDYWAEEDAWQETDHGPRLSEASIEKLENILGCKLVQMYRRQ